MQKVNAFYYEFNYYILPENLSMEQLQGSVSVKQLCTGDANLGSIAPHFIDSLIQEVTLDVAYPQRVFPATAYVYTKDEYDALLKSHVYKKCNGCSFYTPDTTGDFDPTGHYVEIDLDGNCYLRRTPLDRMPFYDVIAYIIGKLENKFDKIKKCVQKGNDKALAKIFNKDLSHVMFPVDIFGRIVDGKVYLYLRTYGHLPEYALDMVFLAKVFNSLDSKFVADGWQMVAEVPSGVAKYRGKTKLDSQSKVAYFTTCGENGQSELRVFIPDYLARNSAKSHQFIEDVESYLTCELGEKLYYLWCNIRAIDDDSALMTLDDVVRAIRDYKSKQPEPPFPKVFEIDMTDPQNVGATPLPNRENLLQLATTAPNIVTMTAEEVKRDDAPTIWLHHYTFGYLYLPNVTDEQTLETLFWYMDGQNNCNVEYDSSNLSYVCGQGICKNNGLIIDMLLPSKNKALEKFRSILPVLKSFNAQLSLLDESLKVDTYICTDKFEKLSK